MFVDRVCGHPHGDIKRKDVITVPRTCEVRYTSQKIKQGIGGTPLGTRPWSEGLRELPRMPESKIGDGDSG